MSHHSPFIPKSTLELAKERLSAFMADHGASIDECAKLMGLASSDALKDLMKAEEHHSHDAMVMQFFAFGADEKLQALRSPAPLGFDISDIDDEIEGGAPVDTASKPTQGADIAPLPMLAKRMFDLYRKGQACKVTSRDAVLMMNKRKPAFINREFNVAGLSVALAPSSIKRMRDEYAEDILLALAHCPWSTFPDELKRWQGKAAPVAAKEIKIKSKPTFQENAPGAKQLIAALDEIKDILGISDIKLSEKLGCGASFIGGIRDRAKKGMLKQQAVDDTMARVKKFEATIGGDTQPVAEDAAAIATASPAKVVDIKHRPFAQGKCAKDEGEQGKSSTETVRITPELACLDETIDFMLGNENFQEVFYKRVAAKAEQRVADILGASPEDLKGVAPMVDMLIAAKRGGLRVRMVVES